MEHQDNVSSPLESLGLDVLEGVTAHVDKMNFALDLKEHRAQENHTLQAVQDPRRKALEALPDPEPQQEPTSFFDDEFYAIQDARRSRYFEHAKPNHRLFLAPHLVSDKTPRPPDDAEIKHEYLLELNRRLFDEMPPVALDSLGGAGPSHHPTLQDLDTSRRQEDPKSLGVGPAEEPTQTRNTQQRAVDPAGEDEDDGVIVVAMRTTTGANQVSDTAGKTRAEGGSLPTVLAVSQQLQNLGQRSPNQPGPLPRGLAPASNLKQQCQQPVPQHHLNTSATTAQQQTLPMSQTWPALTAEQYAAHQAVIQQQQPRLFQTNQSTPVRTQQMRQQIGSPFADKMPGHMAREFPTQPNRSASVPPADQHRYDQVMSQQTFQLQNNYRSPQPKFTQPQQQAGYPASTPPFVRAPTCGMAYSAAVSDQQPEYPTTQSQGPQGGRSDSPFPPQGHPQVRGSRRGDRGM